MNDYPTRVSSAAGQLLAPLEPPQQRLIELLGEAYRHIGRWPVAQFVTQRLGSAGLDVHEVAASLPRVSAGGPQPITYGLIAPGGRFPSQDGDRVALTVAGLLHLSAPGDIVEAYLDMLDVLEAARRSARVEPDRVVDIGISWADLKARMGWPTELQSRVLGMLPHEPFAWLTQVLEPNPQADDSRRQGGWIEPSALAAPLAASLGPRDYVHRVTSLLLPVAPAEAPVLASPIGLATALDYLDVVWRVVFGQNLFVLPGAEKVTRLAFDVATPDEFDSRLSALADTFARLNTKGLDTGSGSGGHKLEQVCAAVRVKFPAVDLTRVSAVRRALAAAVDLRNGLQHSDRPAKMFEALDTFGVRYPVNDYGAAWTAVSQRVAWALNDLREILQEELAAVESG